MLIIPAIDLIGGKCVRLRKGNYAAQTTYSEDPAGQALKLEGAGFRRLHVVDLEGAKEGSGRNREAIRKIVEAVKVPVQIGGGIRSSQDVEQLLSWGARYLILGTVALKQPQAVGEWIERWGAAPFIISLDLRGGRLQSQGWLEESPVSLQQMSRRLLNWGVKQVISTDIEKDGTLDHPNYETYSRLRVLLRDSTTLIAAGGVCCLAHIAELKRAGVDAAIVGKAVYEGTVTLEDWARAG
ncbi:MAG: 1-(5-phosphoribosyl)-5-[(5-phosphoribosylamino)methylideneamino]imidazole-4-carboxamide isomerase [Acidobacteriota bacterium]